jgi:hypothetical protein
MDKHLPHYLYYGEWSTSTYKDTNKACNLQCYCTNTNVQCFIVLILHYVCISTYFSDLVASSASPSQSLNCIKGHLFLIIYSDPIMPTIYYMLLERCWTPIFNCQLSMVNICYY